jgi:hypothetical protein
MTNVGRIAAGVALVLVGVAATTIAGQATQSSRPASSFHVNGPGGKPCAEMTNNLQMDRPTWRAFYTSYVEGFFSGANYVSYAAKQPNAGVGFDITPDEQWAAIEQYCAAHPTKGIHNAVEGLYSRLVAR